MVPSRLQLRFCALSILIVLALSSAAMSLALPTSGSDRDALVERDMESRAVTYWQPKVGAKFNYLLLNPKTSLTTQDTGVDAFFVDLFDNTAANIKTLKAKGAHVVCYFSAGTYENWRSDKSKFKSSDLGNNLDAWPGERWLKVNSTNVRSIMKSRLELAKSKGCDGVDPDNVDGFDNDNGLGLTKSGSINYVNFLATEAHSRGLAIGLKNAVSIASKVISGMQWSVNEQCHQYNECAAYQVFIKAGKPVFEVEYPKGDEVSNNKAVSKAVHDGICNNSAAKNFSKIIKNINLDAWTDFC
ncbi:unnamed protein product [Jaminaea pallidilutea]